MFQHIIQELITKAITQQTEKIIEKKTKKQIKKKKFISKNLIFLSLITIKPMLFINSSFLLIILTLCMIIQFKNNHFR